MVNTANGNLTLGRPSTVIYAVYLILVSLVLRVGGSLVSLLSGPLSQDVPDLGALAARLGIIFRLGLIVASIAVCGIWKGSNIFHFLFIGLVLLDTTNTLEPVMNFAP